MAQKSLLSASSQSEIRKIRKLVGRSKRIVFVTGNFNIVHPGHLRLLRFAKDCGEFLVVAVNNYNPPEHLISPQLRLEGVESIGIVSHAFLLKDSPEMFIGALKPDCVVKGKEHEDLFNPEVEVIQSYGGKLLFGSGEISFSSRELLRAEFLDEETSDHVKPVDFIKRRKIKLSSLKVLLSKFSSIRVTVVGDLIIDEYINCDPLGMSREDPVIVVTPTESSSYVGGAGIVAAHASGMGATVNFVSVTGADDAAKWGREKLEQNGVKCSFFEDQSRPTTMKKRYRCGGKTVFRVSELRQHSISRDLVDKMYKTLQKLIKKTDLLIFSDFNYGCLPQELVEMVSTLCRASDVPMVADSQSSSQVGDISRYKNMLLVCPTEHEARLAMRDFESGLVVLSEALWAKTESKNVIITLGSEGILVHSNLDTNKDLLTDRLPALNLNPKDVAGAGDSFVTCAAMSLVAGGNIWQSALLGSMASAIQVSRVGNTPLSQKDLIQSLKFLE